MLCNPVSRVMSEKTQITDKYPTSSPRTRLNTIIHYINENNSALPFSPLSVTAVLTAWRSWRLQNHIHWTNLSSSSSVFTLCFQEQHVTSEPQKNKYTACKGSHTLQESVSCDFTCLNHFRKSGTEYTNPGTKFFSICGHNMCHIYMSNDSVIRNQLLYQLCT